MDILILGADGYIGWPLALHLKSCGHYVIGMDDESRRNRVESLTPITSVERRWADINILFRNIEENFASYDLEGIDAVVHLAEMPSAPWSMQGVDHTIETHNNNVNGTLRLLWALREHPHVHLIKLGTMGEYGTPGCEIPEGEIPQKCTTGYVDPISKETFACQLGGLQFPRQAGSFYHLTKVHDSANIQFACRNWNLRSTDIMQGVVYGLADTDEELITRFDYDEFFGTAINRFIVQAIAGISISPYGKGFQKRGFLTLNDSIKCIQLAIENPPEAGKYRVFNQFANTYMINELAELVRAVAKSEGFETDIKHIHNPRNEAEEHYYNPMREKLTNLGYEPDLDMAAEVARTIRILMKYRSRIIGSIISPHTLWSGGHLDD